MIFHAQNLSAAEAEGPRSQTSKAYELIRTEILFGRHAPEKKLKIQELAEELEVSPGAVREALSRLVPEGLVVSREQRGFVVAPLSVADLEDLTDLRCEVEALALRRSVERGDVNWEARILAAEHTLRKQTDEPDQDPRVTWARNHAQFHTALISACGNRRLLALHGQLYEQSERYRGLLFSFESDRDVNDEHAEIVRHALARDSDALVGATVRHLRATTELIIRQFVRGAKSDGNK